MILIYSNFITKSLINNSPTLVQAMARSRTGDKSLSEPMFIQDTDNQKHHSASMN